MTTPQPFIWISSCPPPRGLRVVRADLKGRRGRLAMRCARHL